MHSAFHFALGLAIGTVAPLPFILKQLLCDKKTAASFRKWLVASYMLAGIAVIPNILRRVGVPEEICTGWWMNIFLFHPLIDKLKAGGMLIGEGVIIVCFTLQYLILVMSVIYIKTLRPREQV